MDTKVNLDNIYKPSEDVVVREIQGEVIIVPITSGVGDLEAEIFTLNETGRAIWDKLDGKKTLKNLAEGLASEFDVSAEEIEKDVLGLAQELFKRKMIVECIKK